MIRTHALSMRRGPRLLFEKSTLTIHSGKKIGVTGANGTGKSSFFALILGEIDPDEGRLEIPSDWVIAHVAQETPALRCSAIDLVMDGDRELRYLQQELIRAEQSVDGLRQGELFAQMERIDGFNAYSRAARLMHRLGFTADQERASVQSFSGGWRMRLNLAQALMARSDLLLLDEPTNHLDLDTVFWLEDWLKRYKGTLLLISHDRDVLDRTVDSILHIEHQKMHLTPGHYSAFEHLRAERMAQQRSHRERQQRERVRIHRFVERFRAKATKARQVQSRIKALERMEIVAPAHVDSPFCFHFMTPEKLPHPLLTIDRAQAGYNDVILLNDFSISLNPGDRIALLGRNGAGKSTLMKLLADSQTLLQGDRHPSKALRIGYFAQHQLELLDLEASPFVHLQRNHPEDSEQDLRDYLGGFGFRKERVFESVAPFSGGEKARLVLAIMIRQRPNLLLLDEPTNHLDLEMRHALVVALQTFEGALVIVSHDRYLIEGVADRFLLIADHHVKPFQGDLNDYAQWLRSPPLKKSGNQNPTVTPVHRKEQQRQLASLKKRINQMEQDIDQRTSRQSELDEQLAQSEIYEKSSRKLLEQILQEKKTLTCQISQKETALLELYETLCEQEKPDHAYTSLT